MANHKPSVTAMPQDPSKESSDTELEDYVELAELLVSRLERISPDSSWARRASGHRASLLRWLEAYEAKALQPPGGQKIGDKERERLKLLLQAGFTILEQAAREYGKDQAV